MPMPSARKLKRWLRALRHRESRGEIARYTAAQAGVAQWQS